VPEIDEAFLKPLNCESVEVLRERIRGHLEGAARQQDRERRFHQIVDYLVKAAPFELPAAEFERRTEEALNRLVQYGMRRGASKEELAAERDRLTSTARQQADMQIRSTMILRRIADKLDIKLDDDEFKSYLAQTFDRQRLADAQVKEIVKDRERVRALYGEAVVHKTLEALLEKAKPTDTLNA
jgi:FKBP-type peptidyl-prolyl cis-trans isomerase (trigger factor)